VSVKELSREQLEELKQAHLCLVLEDIEGRAPSCGELARADEIISDETVYNVYAGTVFSADDFFCTVGKE